MAKPSPNAAPKGGDETLPLAEVLGEAGALIESLNGKAAVADTDLAREMGRIAATIAQTRADIRQLGAGDASEARIPRAGRELEEIVRATEDATNRIMSAAESILGADTSDTDGFQALVTEQVMEIFEACSFQDITGQRVSRVVQTLGAIEERIASLAGALGIEMAGAADDADEAGRTQRQKDLLLNGPALKGEGVDQTAVDDLFGGAAEASQDAIDSLFD